MLFNPLFLQVINNQEALNTKTQKLSNPSYLFSDIIKVSVENEMQNSSGLGSPQPNNNASEVEIFGNQTINIPIELKNTGLNSTSIENVLEQLINQILPKASSDNLQKTGLTKEHLKNAEQSVNDGKKVLFDQQKVYELISKLINNKEFSGKANLVIDRQKLLQDNYSSALDDITKDEITPETLLNLLKMGNKISLESSPADKNLGLLITLVEHNSQEDDSGLKDLTGSLDYGVKNIFRNKNKESNDAASPDNIQNLSLSDNITYEIRINVIEQNANINQIDNFTAPEINIDSKPDNKIKVDIVLKDSTAETAKTDLNMLTKLTPPEELFASASANTNELSKISSSFSNSLGGGTQQLKATATGNENLVDVSKNVSTENPDTELIDGSLQGSTGNQNKPQETNNNPEIKGESINNNSSVKIPNTASTLEKTAASESGQNTQTVQNNLSQNNISSKKPESNPVYTKLSDSIKSKLVKNPDYNSTEKIKNTENKPTGVDSSFFGKMKSVSEKGFENKTDVKLKAEKSLQPESEINNEQLTGQKIADEKTAISDIGGKSITESKPAEKSSNSLVNEKPVIEDGKSIISETNKQPVKEEKGILSKESSENVSVKQVNIKDAPVNNEKDTSTQVNNKDIHQQNNLNDNPKESGTKVNYSDAKNKVIENENLNNTGTEKEVFKVPEQHINPMNTSEEKKTDIPDATGKNESSAKLEMNDTVKVNQNVSEEKMSNDNNKNQEKSMTDSNKNSDEYKKAEQNKVVNETSFDKTFDTAIKDKAGIDKGYYTDAARTVKAAEIAKEISKHIQGKENNTLYLKIDPEHLGTVKITVETVDKMIRANIEVENESARKLIENNLNQLYNNLNQNGVQLNSLNISLSNFEQKQGGKTFASKKKAFEFGEGNGADENYDSVNEKKFGYNTYEYTV